MVAWSSQPLLACCSCHASCRSGGEGHEMAMQVCSTHHAGGCESAVRSPPKHAQHPNGISYGSSLRTDAQCIPVQHVHGCPLPVCLTPLPRTSPLR